MKAELRCKQCNKKLGANLQGKVEIVCPKCRVFNKFTSGYESHELTKVETVLY